MTTPAITPSKLTAAERAVARQTTLRNPKGLPLTPYEWSTIAGRVVDAVARFGLEQGPPRSNVYLALRADARLGKLPLATAYLTDTTLTTIADAAIYAIQTTE